MFVHVMAFADNFVTPGMIVIVVNSAQGTIHADFVEETEEDLDIQEVLVAETLADVVLVEADIIVMVLV